MKIISEKIENVEATFELEAEPEELDRSMEEASRHISHHVSIPGFRKGKAPRTLVEQYVGKESVLEEALKKLVPSALTGVLKERDLRIVVEPRLRIMNLDPIKVEAVVATPPKVELGDYLTLRLEPQPIEIKDVDVETAINRVREQRRSYTSVNRGVKEADLCIMDIKCISDGKVVLDLKSASFEIAAGSPVPVPGFSEKLVDLSRGPIDEFGITFDVHSEHKELAGKTFTFNVLIIDIKEKQLPEIDDEFARFLGSENLSALKENIKSNLEKKARELEKTNHEQRIIDDIVNRSKVEYSEIIVDYEVSRIYSDEASNFRDGATGLESYIKNQGQKVEDHLKELRLVAEKRIIQSAALSKIGEAEKIEVTQQDIDSEIQEFIKQSDSKTEEIGTMLKNPDSLARLAQNIMGRKIIQHLVDINSVNLGSGSARNEEKNDEQ